MANKICPGCGTEMDPDAIFCNECGLASVASDIVVGIESDPISGGRPVFSAPQESSARVTTRTEPPPDEPERAVGHCALCNAEIDPAARLCSRCTLDIGQQFSSAFPAPSRDSEWRELESKERDRGPSVMAAQFTDAVRTRYRDAYYYSRFIDTIGKILKGIGFVGGGLIFVVGLAIMGGGPRSGIGSVDSAAVGLGLIIFGLYGGLWMFIWWLWGVVWRAAGQFLKASLDGAVHTSPFLSDLDRAEIMSLVPTSKKNSVRPDGRSFAYSNPVSAGPTPWEQLQTWTGKQNAGRVIVIAYLAPLALPVLVFAFGVSLATESRVFSLIPSFFALPVAAVTVYLILSVKPHKTDDLIRFHTYQALTLLGIWAGVQLLVIILSSLLSPPYEFEVPLVLVLFNVFASLGLLLVMAVAAAKGSNREHYAVPFIGDWVRKRTGKIKETSGSLGL